jgi:hypothetical protein
MPTEELVDARRHAGRFALDVPTPRRPATCCCSRSSTTSGRDLRLEAERNLALARALLLLGDSTRRAGPPDARGAPRGGGGDASIATRAATRFALPADWQAGDARVIGMIERVQRMPSVSDEDRTRILATRAWVEARLPVSQAAGQQVSWIGRPGVARPLAEEALAASSTQSPATRLVALLSWRHTHRAPQFLAERRAVSSEALTIAEQLGAHAEQVEAAVMLAVDALEAGDRTAHRAALTTAAAVAERAGDARLRWRALVPAAGIALMEDDVPGARALAGEAFAAGRPAERPGSSPRSGRSPVTSRHATTTARRSRPPSRPT